jgi:hypothetical protein
VYATHRFLRDKRWLLDGEGSFFDCGAIRDSVGYRDVTQSSDPEVRAARKRFDQLLAKLPGPPEDMRRRWEEMIASQPDRVWRPPNRK